MRVAVCALGFFLLSTALVTAAATEQDRVVFGVLKRVAPDRVRVHVLHRVPVAKHLDLVLAAAWSEDQRGWEDGDPDGSLQLGVGVTLGVFLQEQTLPFRVFTISAENGPADCWATLQRATATDILLSCTNEGKSGPSHKFVYDVRAKRLVDHFTFPAYELTDARVVGRSSNSRVEIRGHNESESIVLEFTAQSRPTFRVTNRGAAVEGVRPVIRASDCPPFGPSRAFRLADPDPADDTGEPRGVESLVAGRRRFYRMPLTTEPKVTFRSSKDRKAGFDEWIGPCQVFDDQLWFGLSFYAGEGQGGRGGLGFFSPVSRAFTIYTGEAIRIWSAAALLVERDAVWIALEESGEGTASSAGVVRFDRQTKTFEAVWESEGIGRKFVRFGEDLLLLTDVGVSVMHDGKVVNYIVARMSNGSLRVVESLK